MVSSTASVEGKEMKQTLLQVYVDRDDVRGYWKALGLLAAALILLGFQLFPLSFAPSVDMTANGSTLSIIAVLFLALGYSLSVALWLLCTNLLFLLDGLFIPCFFSCSLGILNTLITFLTHNNTAATPSSISAIAVSVLSTTIFATLTFITSRSLGRLRRSSPLPSSRAQSLSPINPNFIHPDELQRQQLSRLLSSAKDRPSVPFSQPTSTTTSTFRIQIPDSACVSNATHKLAPFDESVSTTYLAAPTDAYEPRGRLGSNASSTLSRPISPSTDADAPMTTNDDFAELSRARARSAKYKNPDTQPLLPRPQPQQSTPAILNVNTSTHTIAPSSTLSPYQVDTPPPVIVNTQHAGLDGVDLGWYDRHPLERDGRFIRGVPDAKVAEEEGRAAGPGMGMGIWRSKEWEEGEEERNSSYCNPTSERVRAAEDLERGWR